MTITYRLVKGSALTHAELDGNFTDLSTTRAGTAVFTAIANGLAPLSGGGTSAYLRADGTWATPAGAGDMVLASAQTNSGAKTFADATLKLAGATSGSSTLKAPAVAGVTVFTLPTASTTLIGTDTTDTLTNKPISAPTITGVSIAPTAAADTNTTQLATTAHVFAERTNAATLTNKTLTTPVLTSPTLAGNTVGNSAAPGGQVVALAATTLTLSAALHNGNVIAANNAAAITISLDSTSDLTAGAVIIQTGAGIVTVSGTATNTFPNGASTSGVGTTLIIVPTGTDTYTVQAAPTGDSTLVNATAGATPAIDMAKYNVHDLTLTANCTPTFSGAVSGKSYSVQLILRQDATGGRTLTLPTTIWSGGTDFVVSSAANAISVVTLQTLNGGTSYIGYIGGNAFAT